MSRELFNLVAERNVMQSPDSLISVTVVIRSDQSRLPKTKSKMEFNYRIIIILRRNKYDLTALRSFLEGVG